MQLSSQNRVSLFNFSQTKISLAPQIMKNADVRKILNGPYLAKWRFFVTISSFTKFIGCTVLPRISDIFMQLPMSHDVLWAFFGSKVVQFVKDWTFWRVPKTGYFFIIVLCTKKLCILWRTERFGWQKSDIFVQFWHIFRFCTKGKPLKKYKNVF